MTSAGAMRTLAAWYRGLAEATDNPAIWESRLHTAEDLDDMAMRADSYAQIAVEAASA